MEPLLHNIQRWGKRHALDSREMYGLQNRWFVQAPPCSKRSHAVPPCRKKSPWSSYFVVWRRYNSMASRAFSRTLSMIANAREQNKTSPSGIGDDRRRNQTNIHPMTYCSHRTLARELHKFVHFMSQYGSSGDHRKILHKFHRLSSWGRP